jgi:hypothetical protein
MGLAKPILLAAVAIALAVYALDCGAMTTPEEAMQCCNSMPCPSQGHDHQDCCKTMAAMHAPFVQPSSSRHVSISPILSAVLPASSESQVADSFLGVIAAHRSAPPSTFVPFPLPLRI